MSKKTLPVFVPLVVLLVASLSCNFLSGGATSGIQATANAAFTQAAAGATAAGSVGNSALATANAASTQAMATANAATGGGGEPTATTAAGGGGGGTSSGPKDIPLVSGAKNTVQVAGDKVLTYFTDADIATVVKFYKGAMPEAGWTAIPTLSVETATASTLGFSAKDGRTAVIVIGTSNGQTVVAVTVS